MANVIKVSIRHSILTLYRQGWKKVRYERKIRLDSF